MAPPQEKNLFKSIESTNDLKLAMSKFSPAQQLSALPTCHGWFRSNILTLPGISWDPAYPGILSHLYDMAVGKQVNGDVVYSHEKSLANQLAKTRNESDMPSRLSAWAMWFHKAFYSHLNEDHRRVGRYLYDNFGVDTTDSDNFSAAGIEWEKILNGEVPNGLSKYQQFLTIAALAADKFFNSQYYEDDPRLAL